MKLLASAAALACAAVLALVAGPALSVSPWRPAPVDFELAPAGSPAAATLAPPRRFNLVGMRWRGRAEPRIELRTHAPDGAWSRWTRVEAHVDHAPDPGRGEPAPAASDPVWVGEADRVQYRLARRVPGLRLHFVNVEGTGTAVDRVETAVRRGVSTALAPLARMAGARDARAQGSQPAIVPRADWGADRCPPAQAPEYGSVKVAFVHHTVSTNDYAPAESPDIVLAICRYHRYSNGWNDIGYNFLVDRYGTIFEGRAGGVDQPVVGAQAQGYNTQSTGIANIGTFSDVPQSDPALKAMARLIRWKLPLHGAPTAGSVTLVSAGGSSNRYPAGTPVVFQRIAGHRDGDLTECPGQALYDQLPQLRALVGNLSPTGTATFLRAAASPRTVRYRGQVTVSGNLAAADGSPLSGQAVALQSRIRGRWHTVTSAATDAGGGFTGYARPRANRRLRARYAGAGDFRPATSQSMVVRVRALLRLYSPATRSAAGRRVGVRGRVAPAKRRVTLVVQRRAGGRWERLLVRRLATRRGRFGTSFAPPARGRYRYYVSAPQDGQTLRGRSPLVALVVVGS